MWRVQLDSAESKCWLSEVLAFESRIEGGTLSSIISFQPFFSQSHTSVIPFPSLFGETKFVSFASSTLPDPLIRGGSEQQPGARKFPSSSNSNGFEDEEEEEEEVERMNVRPSPLSLPLSVPGEERRGRRLARAGRRARLNSFEAFPAQLVYLLFSRPAARLLDAGRSLLCSLLSLSQSHFIL